MVYISTFKVPLYLVNNQELTQELTSNFQIPPPQSTTSIKYVPFGTQPDKAELENRQPNKVCHQIRNIASAQPAEMI